MKRNGTDDGEIIDLSDLELNSSQNAIKGKLNSRALHWCRESLCAKKDIWHGDEVGTSP